MSDEQVSAAEEVEVVIPPIERGNKFKKSESTKAATAAVELLSFEEWFALREKSIPSHHHREILKADFKGQKVPDKATADQFDSALARYGVKLK